MKISLIAVDLDGTLLTSSRKLAREGAALLRQASEQGIRVVLASAREPSSVRAYCAEMGLNDPIICFSGAQVWSAPEGDLWASATIPHSAALAIAEHADRHGWELMTTVGAMGYWKQRPGQAIGALAPNRAVLETNAACLASGARPARILVFDPQAVVGLDELCRARFQTECRSELFVAPDGRPESLGIFPAGCDKGSALRQVIDRLGVPPGEVMAVGDNLVDLPMFDAAYVSVAMGNAPIKVKQRAAAVAPTNDQEGVAWAVREFVSLAQSTQGSSIHAA